MIVESLKELYNKDLNKLRLEIKKYKDDSTLWEIENVIKNSGGNLCPSS